MPACLLLLIGLPSSGKTSLARRLCVELADTYRVTHVEYDAAVPPEEQERLQAARASGGDAGAWRQARRELEQAVEAALQVVLENEGISVDTGDSDVDPGCLAPPLKVINQLTSTFSSAMEAQVASDRPHVYIIDDNMYLRSMRYRYFQMARRRGAGFCQVLLHVPEAECVARNNARSRPVPAAAVSAISSRLEPPAPSDRLWEASTIMLKPCEIADGMVRLAALIAAALASPAAPLVDNSLEVAAARRVCSESQRHQADVALRQMVREQAARAGSGRPERARAANAARQALLRRIRAGKVGVTVEPTQSERFGEVIAQLFQLELQGGSV